MTTTTTTKRTVEIEASRTVRTANVQGHIVPTLDGEWVAILEPEATHGIIVSHPTGAALEDAHYGGGERVTLVSRPVIYDEQIARLHDRAAEAGDVAQALICRIALRMDVAAANEDADDSNSEAIEPEAE